MSLLHRSLRWSEKRCLQPQKDWIDNERIAERVSISPGLILLILDVFHIFHGHLNGISEIHFTEGAVCVVDHYGL